MYRDPRQRTPSPERVVLAAQGGRAGCRYAHEMSPDPRVTRILELVAEYARDRHRPAPFDPAAPRVSCAGRVFGEQEVVDLVRTSLDFWLTAGPETEAFERRLRETTGHRHALLVNSGSSANLLALTALTSPRLRDRRLQPGDEVITVAAGFPTTVNPIIQNGLVPVFVEAQDPEDAVRPQAPARAPADLRRHLDQR